MTGIAYIYFIQRTVAVNLVEQNNGRFSKFPHWHTCSRFEMQ